MSALAAVGTSAGTGYATAKFLQGARGQVTDRFGKAVEQLGSNATDVRLGAIYSLERLMNDSTADQPTIMEVLSAYIREHTAARTQSEVGPSIDVQAALTVLGRRNAVNDKCGSPEIVEGSLCRVSGERGGLIVDR